MLVYNGTSGQITSATTQNLVFSISGENVSVGDIFGTHTFDVSGSSNLNGNLTVSGSVGIGKLTPNSDYTLDMYGNLLLTAKGTGASQQPTLTLQYDSSPYTYISSSSITEHTSNFSGQLTFQAGSFSFNNSIDVSGNTNITGSLELSGNKINITNSTPNSSIAMGYQAGYIDQNQYSIAIGFQTGFKDQNLNAIAIGQSAGYMDQNISSIAMGFQAGNQNQNQYSIAIGQCAGYQDQSANSIAIGQSAAYQNQNISSIAIGQSAGNQYQNQYSIAMGYQAGFQNQNHNSIAIGYSAGYLDQNHNSIAIGYNAGKSSQNQYSIAIGYAAGQNDQSANSIAIGKNAGLTSLGENSIAIGSNTINQYNTSVALGAGATTTANNQIVLGTSSETVYIPGGLNEPNVNGRLYIKSYNNSDYGTAYSNLDGSANTFMSFDDYGEQTFSRLRHNIDNLASGVTRGLEYQAGDNWPNDQYSFRITHYDSNSGTQAWPFFMIDGTRENNQINGNLFINTGEFSSGSTLNSTSSGLTIQSIESDNTTATTNAYIYGNGQAFFSSKVGIGTDTPSYTLDVSGTGNFTDNLTVTRDISNSALINVIGPGKEGTYVMYGLDTFSTSNFTPPRSGPAVQIRATDTGGYAANLSFWTAENALPVPEGDPVILKDAVERMTIDTSGNVGIGTDTPGYTLDVSGTGNFTDNLTVTNPNGNSALIDVIGPGGEGSYVMYGLDTYQGRTNGPATQIRATDQGGDAANLSFWTSNKTTTGDYADAVATQRMVIDTSGNVGIGTDTPTYTLDVSGTVYISNHFSSGGTEDLLTSKVFDQGTIINWNNSGGDGETDFINSKGTGAGGFNFYNIASGQPPLPTTPDPLMTISSTGIVTATSFIPVSDVRLKENITNLDNSLDKICNIRGVNYNWKNDETNTKTAGVIAQEVLEQIPEAVIDSDSEKLSVNYNSIIAYLIESVKELKREIDELKAK
jgi:hypothetical protein